MFNWICPTCGKEVQPSKTECPYCAERAKEMAGAPVGAPPPPYQAQQQPQQQPWQPAPPPATTWQPAPPPAAPHVWQPPPPPQSRQQPNSASAPTAWPQQSPPPQHVSAPPPPPLAPPEAQPQYNAPPPPPAWNGQHPPYGQQPPAGWQPTAPRSGPPTWLMFVAFALAFLGVFAAVYFFIQRNGRTNVAEKTGLENPANPSQQKVSNPLQKYVEVSGLRLMTDNNKKPVVKFLVTNHSNAEIADLEANVTLWASTSRSEEDSIGSFSFKANNLAASGSREFTEPLKTKLKMYELPDWQNATAEIQITSPAAQ
ncbi:MAG TPA: hypothetical protein VKB79_28375 [Bryobacteraceae bacterium]|nr:hypothetical protein [Bryobacteraceae bacterium]